jgi:hypothetical protein
MSHYALIENDIVTNVVVAEADWVAQQAGEWVQTSYNTKGGVHSEGGTPLRKNYAGIGYTYNKTLDAFIPPKPYPSWVLDESTGLWAAPKPKPDMEKGYLWDESITDWVYVPYPSE